MRKGTGIAFVLLATLAVFQPTEAKRKSKKNKNAIAALVKDSVNADYKKVIKNAAVQKGLFTTLYNAKEGKLYFEIPDSAFGRTYILANRVAATSNTRDFVAGQIATQPLLIRFSKDERNMENIRTSDSPNRFARLTERINEDLPIDVSKAASILRDHKGLQNSDLGLANEMTINQFIAHHSVIFQPEKRLMWVSTSPWQCGKYVAYDLNKIFKDTIDWQHEIYSSDLTIPEKKKLTPLLLKKIRKKEQIEESVLKTYQASNPSLYYVYEVIGDYYEAMQQSKQAIAYWQQALKKSIPKLQEKERIQQKIQKQSKDGKES